MQRCSVRSTLFLLSLSTILVASVYATPASPSGSEPAAPLHDVAEDKTLWSLGASWKASFSRDATRYIPFLGSDAPRNYPLELRVAEVSIGGVPIEFDREAAPARTGDIVDYARGAFVERYELASDSIEQLFVFDTLPARGELVVRIATASELEASERDDALEFANERGSVRYTRAIALDALGRSVSAPTALSAHGIEIRVPAEFVATARLPLVIDPVISTATVFVSSFAVVDSDVAYDPGTNRRFYVYETAFSANDHDVHFRAYAGGSGLAGYVPIAAGAIETGQTDWRKPALAGHAGSKVLLVVAEETTQSGQRRIRGRTLGALDLAPILFVTIASDGPTNADPDVGGDSVSPAGAGHYTVVWRRESASGESDVRAATVTPSLDAAVVTALDVDVSSGTIDLAPSISKSNPGGVWNVAWSRRKTPSDHDVLAARLGLGGTLAAAPFTVDVSTGDDHAVAASSNAGGSDAWTIAFERRAAADADVVCWLVSGATPTSYLFLTQAEIAGGSGGSGRAQREPDVESDAGCFVVAYAEDSDASGLASEIRISTVARVGDELVLGEAHQALPSDGSKLHRPKLAPQLASGGGQRRHFVAWDQMGSVPVGSFGAAIYDAGQFASFCRPGVDATLACPCGNTGLPGRGCGNSAGTGGAVIAATGSASVSASSVVLTSLGMPASALTVFGQGSVAAPAGIVFGQGVRCTGGAQKRLYVKQAFGGVAIAPLAAELDLAARSAELGDPIAPGSSRYYYAYYRDPVVPAGCASSSTFNTTQTLQAIWAP